MAELCKPNNPPFSPWLTYTAKSPYLLADGTPALGVQNYRQNTPNLPHLQTTMMTFLLRPRMIAVCWLGLGLMAISPAFSAAADVAEAKSTIHWYTDYHAGLDEAEARRQLAFIWFYNPTDPVENERLEREVLSQDKIAAALSSRFTPIRLLTSA